MAMYMNENTNSQKIIGDTVGMYSQFNKIYLKISVSCTERNQRIHLLHQSIANLLQYLSLKQDQFCVSFISIETRLSIEHSKLMPQLLSEHKRTDKAINIRICMGNECYSGYLCSASDVTLT
eukprot:219347_1